jgi:hypothetical protein
MDLPDLGPDVPPLGQVIAKREFRFTRSSGQSEAVVVSLGAPALVDGTWWCPYEIKSPTFSRSYALPGEDSLQALLGSACILNSELDALARQHDGSLSYFGDDDLMLPSMDWAKREGDAGET